MDFKNIDTNAGRSLQAALVNAIYKQIKANPLEVSASLLAVAERMLARWNMGLIELPEDEKMTEEEKQMIADFEKMELEMGSDHFEKLQ